MKLLFIDEIKNRDKEYNFYGLIAVLIDNSSYGRFKKVFYEKIKKMGWNSEIEIKGRYSFSKTKGDESISVEDRLKFVEDLFELSKTSSTKYASAQVFYTFDIFPKSVTEEKMYSALLDRIIKKLPKGKKDGNKNGKNNIIIFLDNNEAINVKDISMQIEDIFKDRGLFLIERCLNVDSGNETPGIIFADHVAYFIDNYIKTSDFNENNKDKVKLLISKFSENNLSEQESNELKIFMTSFGKEQKSINLLRALKKMTYIK
jgi:hypothetical protein